jgi:CheY-like chemotaxis protein
MKILVIDDSQVHLDAARAQLSNHDLVTAQSYDEAMQIMFDIGRHHERIDGTRQQFDVVLVDLLMPASAAMQNDPRLNLVGQEMPVGIFLALLAAKHGAKFVGLFSDASHHNHPASSCLDAFNKHERMPTPFYIGECKVILTNNRSWVCTYRRGGDPTKSLDLNEERQLLKEQGAHFTAWSEYFYSAKSWDSLLTYLLEA